MRHGKKGFTTQEKSPLSSETNYREIPSIEQILPPAFVAMPDQPHQLARGVQGKGSRLARKFKSSFFRRPITFVVVAAVAAGHQIFPGRSPTPGARHHVIQRQFAARENAPTKLTGIPVAQQYVLAR